MDAEAMLDSADLLKKQAQENPERLFDAPRVTEHTCERCGHTSTWVLRSRFTGNWYCANLDACKRRALRLARRAS